MIILPIPTTSLIHLSLKGWGMYFLPLRVKGLGKVRTLTMRSVFAPLESRYLTILECPPRHDKCSAVSPFSERLLTYSLVSVNLLAVQAMFSNHRTSLNYLQWCVFVIITTFCHDYGRMGMEEEGQCWSQNQSAWQEASNVTLYHL